MIPELNLEKQNKDTNGYMYVYQPDHPMARGSGSVYVHRYIVAKHLGRLLMSDEQVHHIDGNRSNNSVNNLELLSQSAHARLHNSGSIYTAICANCGVSFQLDHPKRIRKVLSCSVFCSNISRRKFDVSKSELEKLVWEMPTTSVAELFGVSECAIQKRCKKLNINKPPRGYWQKLKASNINIEKGETNVRSETN